uniref:Uncharacterized protein ycf35 n=1 Tax=Rhodomela confervoides TaxID=35163 RepID=A0A1Z1MA08_RHOCN|nr:hypothetical protein [Rhodomela confervoides]ARW62615.1 hypothetical protein [Rhodomela confervoides]
MSHFSKIRTNICDLDILIETISQLGFEYNIFSSYNSNKSKTDPKDLVIYDLLKNSHKKPILSFVWNGSEYSIVVDLQLWSLDIDINYFIDRVSQQYAYNMILSQSNLGGFNQISERIGHDGSIRVTLQKWSKD